MRLTYKFNYRGGCVPKEYTLMGKGVATCMQIDYIFICQIGDRETNLSTATQTENSPMPVYDVIDLVYDAAGL